MTRVMPMTGWRMAAAAALLALAAGCGDGDGLAECDEGMAAFGAGDFTRAEKLLRQSVRCNPDNADALVALARTELELGQMDEAWGALTNAERVASGDADVVALRGHLAFHRRDYAKAAEAFATLAGDSSLAPLVRSRGWSGLGVVEMSRSRGTDSADFARIALLKAIRTDKRNAAARYHLGVLYRDSFGYPEAALEQFEIFVRLEQEADPRVQRVQRSAIPDLKEAIARAAADRPNAANRSSATSAAALRRAEAAVKAGRNDTARAEFAAAFKADPLSFAAARGLAECWMKTAPSTRKGGEPNPRAKALDAYLAACRLSPGSISTFLRTGELATKLGHHATAVEVYSRAVAADPANISAIDGLVRALRAVGGRSRVASAYQRYREFVTPGRK